jgi:hypothetical protein
MLPRPARYRTSATRNPGSMSFRPRTLMSRCGLHIDAARDHFPVAQFENLASMLYDAAVHPRIEEFLDAGAGEHLGAMPAR